MTTTENNEEEGFLGKLKGLVFEDDAPKPKPGAPTSSSTPASPASSTPSFNTVSPASGAPATPAVDPELLEAMRGEVFKTASHYTLLMTMHQALGDPQDLRPTLKAVKVSNSGVNKDSVSQDIQGHLSLLDITVASYQKKMDEESHSTAGASDSEIARLTRDNEAAAAEIARHQKETAERATRITELQQSSASIKAKIENGRREINSAGERIRSELTIMQQRVSAL